MCSFISVSYSSPPRNLFGWLSSPINLTLSQRMRFIQFGSFLDFICCQRMLNRDQSRQMWRHFQSTEFPLLAINFYKNQHELAVLLMNYVLSFSFSRSCGAYHFLFFDNFFFLHCLCCRSISIATQTTKGWIGAMWKTERKKITTETASHKSDVKTLNECIRKCLHEALCQWKKPWSETHS